MAAAMASGVADMDAHGFVAAEAQRKLGTTRTDLMPTVTRQAH